MSSGSISVPEIAKRLSIGKRAVYQMLERNIVPAIRIGRRWLITTAAFTEWERTAGNINTSVQIGDTRVRRRSPDPR